MRKILTFIINENEQLLLLHNNPLDPIHGGDIWYTVTGGVEDYDKSLSEAVRREVKEETNLDAVDIMYLNLNYKYTSRRGLECQEYVYICFVQKADVILNEENIGYKWLNLDEFLYSIFWYGDRSELMNLLKYAVNKQLYYQKEVVR